jgi:hypothetical protein
MKKPAAPATPRKRAFWILRSQQIVRSSSNSAWLPNVGRIVAMSFQSMQTAEYYFYVDNMLIWSDISEPKDGWIYVAVPTDLPVHSDARLQVAGNLDKLTLRVVFEQLKERKP